MNETPDIGKMFSQLTSSIGSNATELFNKLKDSSIGEQFQSWIGKGENKPVTGDQVTEALGPDAMNKMAAKTGTTPEQAAQDVAKKLPDMVDRATPDGRLPDPSDMQGKSNYSKPSSIKENLSGAASTAKEKVSGAAGGVRDAMPSGMPGSTKSPQG
jgi:uncharacterized protein YidB (DUF937 family)